MAEKSGVRNHHALPVNGAAELEEGIMQDLIHENNLKVVHDVCVMLK